MRADRVTYGLKQAAGLAFLALLISAIAPVPAHARASAKAGAGKAQIKRQLAKEVRRNPRVIRTRSFLRRAALVNFKLPITIRLRGECPAGAGGSGLCPTGPGNSGLNERGTAAANVDLGPSLGQRPVNLKGSLAAEVTFRDAYDGGALGNVGVEILPSSTKTLTTNSVPLLWNADVDSLSSRTDANFARAAIRAGSSVAPLLTLNGWENKLQGCNEFKNEAANSARTFLTAGVAGSYSALWYGSGIPGGVNGGLPGFPVIDPAVSPTTPAYYLPLFPGIDSLDNLAYGSGFPATGDPDEYLGSTPNPFPYPAMDPNPPSGDPAIAGNARDVVLRTNALSLSIASPGTQVDLATGTPVSPNMLPTGQGSQNVIIGKSGGEANLFGNLPGKGYGIDVTVSLATKINSIFRVQDQDVFDTPLVSGSQYPAGIFNCRQLWSGAVQNYVPGVRLTGNLRISPAITKDGMLRIAKATVNTSQPTRVALSACLMPYRPYGQDTAAPAYPMTSGAGGPSSTPAIPTQAQAFGGSPSLGSNPYGVLPYDSNQIPLENTRAATPDTIPCNATPVPIVRDSSLYGSVEPQIDPSASNGYTTTATGAQATVAGEITVSALKVDIIIGDA